MRKLRYWKAKWCRVFFCVLYNKEVRGSITCLSYHLKMVGEANHLKSGKKKKV